AVLVDVVPARAREAGSFDAENRVAGLQPHGGLELRPLRREQSHQQRGGEHRVLRGLVGAILTATAWSWSAAARTRAAAAACSRSRLRFAADRQPLPLQ